MFWVTCREWRRMYQQMFWVTCREWRMYEQMFWVTCRERRRMYQQMFWVTCREWWRIGCLERFSLKNWRGRVEEEDPGKDGEKKQKEMFK
jgi:hypothetical protein